MEKKPGAMQEADGSTSMRRVLALYFALLAGACFILGILHTTMYGVYSGTICVVAALVLLGLTTVSDWKELAASLRAGGKGE